VAYQRKRPPAGDRGKVPFPGFVEPALATLIDKVPSGEKDGRVLRPRSRGCGIFSDLDMPSPAPIVSPAGEAFARSHSLVPSLRVYQHSLKNHNGNGGYSPSKPNAFTSSIAAPTFWQRPS
jgi:hypothetical protein